MTGDKRKPGEPFPTRPLPKDSKSLNEYGTRDSDPQAFLERVQAEYPQLAQLIAATTVEETKHLVANLAPRTYQPLVALLVTVAFTLDKTGRFEAGLAASRARVEIVRLVDPREIDSFFGNSQPRNLGDALIDLATSLSNQGHLDVALKMLEEAEHRYEEDAALRAEFGITQPSQADLVFGWQDFRSNLYAQLSGLHGSLGNAAEAARYNHLAWQHSQLGETPESRYLKEMQRARNAEGASALDAALHRYHNALELGLGLESSGITSRYIVQALRGLASIHARLGLHRTAVQHLRRCIELNSQMAHRERLCDDHLALAPSLATLGDQNGARTHLDEALRLCAVQVEPLENRENAFVWTEGDEHYLLTRYDMAWQVLRQRARIATDRAAAIADLQWALKVCERLRKRVLADEHRIGTQEETMGIYDDLIARYAEEFAATGSQKASSSALATMEYAKSRVLAEMLSEQELPPPSGAPAELIHEEASLMEAAATLEQAIEQGPSDPLAVVEQLEAVLARLDEVRKNIARAAPESGPQYVAMRDAAPVHVGELAELLRQSPTQTWFVSYYALPDRLLIAALDPQTEQVYLVSQAVGRATLRKWVAVNPNNPPPHDLRLQYWSLDFGPLLIEPLAKLVPPDVDLCFAPHDALHALPLHALEPSVGAAPLVETRALSYVPSASVLRFSFQPASTVSDECLVLGHPDRQEEAPIEHARAEAITVANVLGCEAHVGPAASCAFALARLPSARIIHIACHHRFDAEAPMQSALLLSDGDLTAQQLLGLRLQAELVTLSACQSGVSQRRPGDELMGMVRALLYAGARSVLVSLWNTYDEATAHLMHAFYAELTQPGQSKTGALRHALRQARATKPAATHWAPFVLFGDWR